MNLTQKENEALEFVNRIYDEIEHIEIRKAELSKQIYEIQQSASKELQKAMMINSLKRLTEAMEGS